MNRRLIAIMSGALVTVGAASGRAQSGPGVGTPLVPKPTSTNSRVGTRGANFLEIGMGARANGMAGAYSALAEGLSGLYWNLAGTAEVQTISGGVNYSQLYGSSGLDFIWGGVLVPAGGGAFGIQVGQLSSGTLMRTSYTHPDGGDPTSGSTFTYSSTVAGLSYARRLTDRLNVGGGVKYASEGMTDISRSFIGLDVGIRFRTGLYGTTLGAALANVGSSGRFQGTGLEKSTFGQYAPGGAPIRIDLNTQDAEMPTIFRFSVAEDLMGGPEALLSQATTRGSLRAVGEFSNAIDTDLQAALGVEYGLRDVFFLRAGKRWLNEGQVNSDDVLSGSDRWKRGLAFGGGLRLPLAGRRFQFDYAWQGTGELAANNHFAFEFGF